MAIRSRSLLEYSHGHSVTITKGITIQGLTTTDSDNGTANDQTILVDNLVHVPGDQGFFHCTNERRTVTSYYRDYVHRGRRSRRYNV